MALFLPQITRGVSVLDFGADPSGSFDSTAAFQAAVSATVNSSPIRIPGGTYLINGNTINMASRMWIGDVSSAGRPASVLKARTATTNFMFSSARTHLENIVFDANFLCDFALRLVTAHQSIVFNVDCRHANDFAFFSDRMNVAPITRLTCRLSANGAKFLGANGMVIEDMRLLDNTGLGADFIGVLSGETNLSGQFSIFGFQCSRNGGDGVHIRGVTNGMIAGGDIHSNGNDGIVLDEGTADMLFQGLDINGNGAGGEVAVNSIDAKICTFRGITATGLDAAYEKALLTEPSEVMQFYGCYKSDGTPLDLVYTDGVAEYVAAPDGANLKATSAPTRGKFLRGHIAWNATPTAGSNRGWRCTAAGSPGTWSSF